MDIDIVCVLAEKQNYESYARFVNKQSVSEETWNIIEAMGAWFSYNPTATQIKWGAFWAWFSLVRHAKMDKTKLNVYKEFIDFLEKRPTPDPKDIKPLMEGLATRDYAARIAEKALKISDGDFKESFSGIVDLVEERNKSIGKLDSLESHIVLPSVEALKETAAKGLKWRLNCLNESLGDLRKGDLIVIATRPDTGKTTMLASESTFMAEQLAEEQCVLWVNNEEAGNKVNKRIIQSALGVTTATMDANIVDTLDKYKAKLGRLDKILVYDKADVNVRDVNILLEKYNVGLIIFDQLWKVHGFDHEAGNEVVRQTMLFNWAREIAKKHAPVITVHQADGSAEGVKWIDMSKLYGSKTGIQGEADAIVTIGRLHDTDPKRYVFVPKNKLTGGSDPKLRNGRFEIEIQPEIARFKEPT